MKILKTKKKDVFAYKIDDELLELTAAKFICLSIVLKAKDKNSAPDFSKYLLYEPVLRALRLQRENRWLHWFNKASTTKNKVYRDVYLERGREAANI